jgi:hypothetical protein
MTASELQTILKNLGHYKGDIDGAFGPKSQAATLAALTDGPDTKLCAEDIKKAADALGVVPAKIWAVWDVEASAAPFIEGRPTILFEPHRFSRATGHKYDSSHPEISSRAWNRKLYPKSQSGRWEQMLKAMSLNIDAGLGSASYGGFQILGENHKVCGFSSPWDFVYAQSRNEAGQLLAFVAFVEANGLKSALQQGNWAKFARGYNGSAYAENQYDIKLAAAFAKRSR